MSVDVAIVGGGIAGLCCARRLAAGHVKCVVIEAADAVGGRMRTDRIDGFLLDRGFQVLLDSYPEARDVLDFSSLGLHAFEPGALVRAGGKFHPFADPIRRPSLAVSSLFSPVATLTDKLLVTSVRGRIGAGDVKELYERPEQSTLEYLRNEGFSEKMVEQFFRPFLGGVFLDRSLNTSSRMFEFVFRMFATGLATLPAAGMQAIPEQIAANLPPGTIRLGAEVTSVDPLGVLLKNGERIESRAVVLAADGSTSERLLSLPSTTAWHGVTCLYFSADRPPINDPILVLNGETSGPVNNLCVPSLVCPNYAPPGKALISASVIGIPAMDDATLERDVRRQMSDWFGEQVSHWRHVKTYRIERALPCMFPGALEPVVKPQRISGNRFICGDTRDTASINGAMASGRRAAEAVLTFLGR